MVPKGFLNILILLKAMGCHGPRMMRGPAANLAARKTPIIRLSGGLISIRVHS